MRPKIRKSLKNNQIAKNRSGLAVGQWWVSSGAKSPIFSKQHNDRKEAANMNETLKVLKERRSVRKYKAEQIRDEELNAILEAGTWAPSAKGLQTSVMVVVQDPETIAWMSKLNAEIQGNPGTDPFYGAPTVVVVLGDGEKLNWLQDGSLVMGNLMTAAAALGLGSCWINRAMELFDRPEGKELLKKWGLPETYRGVGNCILGYVEGDLPAPKPRKDGWILRV